jgi:hypothetical protein
MKHRSLLGLDELMRKSLKTERRSARHFAKC